jgi:hypothetical protein
MITTASVQKRIMKNIGERTMSNKTLTIIGVLAGVAILAGVGLALFMPHWNVSADFAQQKGPGGWNNDGGSGVGMGRQTEDGVPQGRMMGGQAGNGFQPGGMMGGRQGGRGNQGGGMMNWDASAALTPLSAAEVDALNRAILDEYRAMNTYQAVIDQLGEQTPFTQIIRAEQMHINALLRQAEKYSVDAPANPGLAETPSFDTLSAACQVSVQAETDNAALYDELFKATTHSDLLQVFEHLQSASLNSHLPAFEACQ